MCSKCKENAEPTPYVDTPIFWSLVDERRKAGYDLPWYRTFKPSGTIGLLDSHSTGIEPLFNISVKRDRLGPRNPVFESNLDSMRYWAGMVLNPNDAVKIIDPI